MRYVVRDQAGRELTVPSLGDLASLYRQGFLGPDDLVRRETSQRWTRAGDLPGLGEARGRRRDLRWILPVLFAAVALVAAVALLSASRRAANEAASAPAARSRPAP
jgi:hypothetical protein